MLKEFERREVINFDTDDFVENLFYDEEFDSDEGTYFYFRDLSTSSQIKFIDSLIESLQKYKAQI